MLERMGENGVTHALCVAVKLETLAGVIGIAERHANIFASVGVHPDNADCDEPDAARLVDLATHPKVVAIGETGLDYYYKHAPPAHQQALLRRFVRLSARTGKPLSLHIRDAHADAQRIISEEGGAPAGGVVHCFTGGPDEAQSWLALGFHISLSGIVTFKSAAAIQAAAQLVPAARLLLETDCPYLAPVPRRGQRNEPAYLVHTGAFVARLRGVSPAELAATSTRAAEELFRLPACDPAPAAPS